MLPGRLQAGLKPLPPGTILFAYLVIVGDRVNFALLGRGAHCTPQATRRRIPKRIDAHDPIA